MSASRSYSFPAPSGSSSATSRSSLKRRQSSMMDNVMYPPSASAYNSRAQPSVLGSSLPTHKPAPLSRQHSMANQTPMDPSSQDPTAYFLHPPFNNFPGAALCPDGLTYSVMAENPEWFLDAVDFRAQDNKNPNAMAYPAQLEPPRGWCPARKKDLKELGADGWPEGEEPRLRCTFCRRTYAGVNAKSMWRRHVYEKHKIAMANRRDGTERVRGRHSNKENKQNALDDSATWEMSDVQHEVASTSSSVPKANFTPARYSGAMDPPPMPIFVQEGPVQHRSTAMAVETRVPVIEQDPFLQAPQKAQLLFQRLEASSNPVTPDTIPVPLPAADTPTPYSPVAPAPAPLSSTPILAKLRQHQSPYNPLATPAFRHSPARLPSDQPWRFPSPSHPLHSSVGELCLGMVARGVMSPPRPTSGIDVSPVVIAPRSVGTPFSSPSVSIFGTRPRSQPDFGIFESASRERLPWNGLANRPTPRRLFSSDAMLHRVHGRTDSSDVSGDASCFSDAATDSGISESSSRLLEPPIQLAGDDPFSVSLSPWGGLRNKDAAQASLEMESPVIRRSLSMGGHTYAARPQAAYWATASSGSPLPMRGLRQFTLKEVDRDHDSGDESLSADDSEDEEIEDLLMAHKSNSSWHKHTDVQSRILDARPSKRRKVAL